LAIVLSSRLGSANHVGDDPDDSGQHKAANQCRLGEIFTFWMVHATARVLDEVTQATWTQPADIKAHYRSASILKNRRVVFNIKGNEYRLVVAVAYKLQIVYVKFVGTNKEYDAVDAETVEMA
jgi:mRNA interferase HigB